MAEETSSVEQRGRCLIKSVGVNIVAQIAYGLAFFFFTEVMPQSLGVRALLGVCVGFAAAGLVSALSILCVPREEARLWWGALPIVASVQLYHYYTENADPELGLCVCQPLCCCARKYSVLLTIALWTLWLAASGRQGRCCYGHALESDVASAEPWAKVVALDCLLPQLQLSFALMPVWGAMRSVALSGPVDLIGALLAFGALGLGFMATRQLGRHHRDGAQVALRTGIFAWCRHPDYLADLLFWLGQALLGLGGTAASETSRVAGGTWSNWWVVALGWLVFAALTVLVAVPRARERAAARVSGYGDYSQEVPALLPRKPKQPPKDQTGTAAEVEEGKSAQ